MNRIKGKENQNKLFGRLDEDSTKQDKWIDKCGMMEKNALMEMTSAGFKRFHERQ